MSKIIGIRELKRHFSRILHCVAAGEDVVIARAGKPVARLVPVMARPRPKRLGLLAGCIEVPDDFNSPLGPQVLADFEDPAPSRPWSSRDGC